MAVFHHLLYFFKNKQSRAIGAPFFLFGLLYGTWATMIPIVKEKFDLNASQLGLLLLCLPIGALIYNPTAAKLIQRYGMEKVTIASMFLLIILSLSWLMVPYLPLLVCVLLVTGMTNTQLNIAMNLCANFVEEMSKVNILATCHGMFSLGLMVGALCTSTSLGMKVIPANHMMLNAAIGMVLAFATLRTIRGIKSERPTADSENFRMSFPKGGLLIMVAISLCTNLAEGTMVDWTSVYMLEVVKADLIYVGWGLAAYSVMMALGRFFGDYFIPKFGNNTVLFYGGLLTAIGLSLAVIIPQTAYVVVGFAMAGAGISCASPILYGSAAKSKDVPQGMGLAILNTFSISGFLFGPVLIGFIAQATNLRISFFSVVGLVVLWMVLTKKVKL